MNFVCLIKLLCADGEIQIVVGSKHKTVISSIGNMSKVVSSDCTLQNKVSELFGLMDCLNEGTNEMNEDEIEQETQIGEIHSDNDNFQIESYEIVSIDSDIKKEILESPGVFSHKNDEELGTSIYNIEETEDDTKSCKITNVNDVNPVVLENIVSNSFDNRALPAMSQYNKELDKLLPKASIQGVQAKMLKSIELEKPFKCGICESVFGTMLEIRNHLKEEHADRKNNKVYKCGYCDKLFNEAYIVQHFFIHKRPYPCNHCDKSFSTIGGLNRHLLYVNGIYKHTCTVCGFRCISLHELNSHMVTHDSSLTHQCPKCGKTFARSSQLNRHIGTHNETRDFQCLVCGKLYKTYSDCRIHLRKHSVNRKRNYKCEFCDKAYYQKDHLMNHKKRAHIAMFGSDLTCDNDTNMT